METDLIIQAEQELFLFILEWIPRLIAYVVTSGIFVGLQTLFSRWILKLRSSKFTVANLFSSFYLVTLAFDGSFIASKAFMIMTIGMVLFWSLFTIGDLLKELSELKLKIGSFELGMKPLRRKDDVEDQKDFKKTK